MITKAIKVIVGVVLPIVILAIFIVRGPYQERQDRLEAEKSQREKTPKKWLAIWSLSTGEYDRGQNEVTIEARIVENDGTKLWFDTVYEYRGATRVARHFLTKKGDRFVGTWYQDEPADSGTLYLRKVAEYTWVGQETDGKGNKAPYTLIRQE